MIPKKVTTTIIMIIIIMIKIGQMKGNIMMIITR